MLGAPATNVVPGFPVSGHTPEGRRFGGRSMNTSRYVLGVLIAVLTGCGSSDRWVDTLSGDCTEEQIEETRKTPDAFAQVGVRVCTETGAGEFAGEFRCTGSTADGTRKLEVRCRPK